MCTLVDEMYDGDMSIEKRRLRAARARIKPACPTPSLASTTLARWLTFNLGQGALLPVDAGDADTERVRSPTTFGRDDELSTRELTATFIRSCVPNCPVSVGFHAPGSGKLDSMVWPHSRTVLSQFRSALSISGGARGQVLGRFVG